MSEHYEVAKGWTDEHPVFVRDNRAKIHNIVCECYYRSDAEMIALALNRRGFDRGEWINRE